MRPKMVAGFCREPSGNPTQYYSDLSTGLLLIQKSFLFHKVYPQPAFESLLNSHKNDKIVGLLTAGE